MDYQGKWKEEIEAVKSIFARLPLEKAFKWGSDLYTFEGKNVVSCYGFKNYFSIIFHNGVFLNDPYGVLVSAQEGKTKAVRHWRLTSREEIDEKKIREYVLESIDTVRKGLKVQPDKFKPLPVPELLENEFARDGALREAFEKLTPGKQKEYIQYLNEAKQEKTKLSRLDKIRPLIREGKGLNDKYVK